MITFIDDNENDIMNINKGMPLGLTFGSWDRPRRFDHAPHYDIFPLLILCYGQCGYIDLVRIICVHRDLTCRKAMFLRGEDSHPRFLNLAGF